MKQNFLILVLGIVVIAIIFVIGAVLNTKPLEQQTLTPYSSEDGISFMYPTTYILSSRPNYSGDDRGDSLILMDQSLASSTPEGGEGPPVISMDVFQNIQNTSLENWIRTNPHSNFKLSQDSTLTPTTVGGEPAFSYHFSGLYEFDAVAVAHGGKLFLLTAAWMNASDIIRTDFTRLVSSVQFP